MPVRKYIIDAATLRRLAVVADADPRSVTKVLNGGTVRGALDARIRAVLLAQGFVLEQASPEVNLGQR